MSKIGVGWLLLGLVFSSCPESLHAQVHSFKNFGLDKNAFPSRIECLEQGASGRMFIGTLAGLVVYDGYRFDQYSERQGLAENAIASIGRNNWDIWLGHWAGSITVFNDSSQIMRSIDLRQALNYSPIRSILPTSTADALLVTDEGKLFRYHQGGVKQLLFPTLVQGQKAISLVRDSSGFFLVAESGLYRATLEGETYEWKPVYESNSRITAASHLFGSEWAIAQNDGLFTVNTQSRESARVEAPMLKSDVVSIVQDQEEFIWFGSAEHGVLQYHPITGESHHIGRDNGLSYNQVRSMFCDREGLVWVATSAGLDQYLGRSFMLYDRRFGLPDNLIWDFHLDDKSVLLATATGLYEAQFDSDFKSVSVLGAAIDLQGHEPRRIFSAAGGRERYVIDERGILWRSAGDLNFESLDHLQAEVQCIEEVNGQVWVGTDEGIYVLSGGEVVETYTEDSGLGGNNVNGIYYSKIQNECWITVLGGACTRYKGGSFQRFGPDEGLTSNVIQDAAFDAEGRPWFASYDDGVIYLENDTFRHLSDQVTLSSNTTFAIEIDENQNVWIGHNWGIDRYRIAYQDLVSFGSDEGFMGVEVNPGALQVDDRNQLWMGTLMGVLRFSPVNYRKNLWEPVVYLNGVRLGDRLLENGESVSESDLASNDLKVSFNAVSLVNPERNAFQYRLRELEQSWREKSRPTDIEYNALPYGSYTLEVRACNNSGKCNASPVKFEFTIKPPFYKSWWFYTLLFLLVVLFIYLMDKFRFTSMLDEKNQLSEKVAAQDQMLIELDQERGELKAYRRYHTDMLSQLKTEVNLPDIKVLNIEDPGLKSDHVVAWKCGDVFVKGLLDTGVNGIASALVAESIKSRLLELLHDRASDDAKTVFEMLELATSEVMSNVEKHKGLQWVLWIQRNTVLQVSLNGIGLYLINDGQVLEQQPTKEGQRARIIELSADDRFFVASDGMTQQLGMDGTRVYSKKRLMSKLLEVANQPSDVILDTMKTDLLEWKDTMDQEDDITLLIHER